MKKKPLFKHDLIALLRSFTPKEQKRFVLYLSSEFFTTRKALGVLFSKLVTFHPLYTDENCSKEALYSEVYPGLSYNGGTIRDLLSELHVAAIDFITIEAIRRKNDNNLTGIFELRQRGLPKQAFKILSEHMPGNYQLKNLDSEYFIDRYNAHIEKINLNTTFRHQAREKSIKSLFNDVRESELSILMFSILEITANYSNFILIEERFQESDPEGFMKSTIKQLRKSGLLSLVKQHPDYGFMVEVYNAMLDAIYNRGKFEQYKVYRDLVDRYSSKFSADEASMHYSKLISCCILGTKYGREKADFNNELLSLYYSFLENGSYRNNRTKYIPSVLFRNVVLHAVKMNNLSWLKKVIGKFANDLQPADIDNMRNFAMAFYYYASGRSGDALETIGKLNITQFIFKYDIYNLKLRIFYENKEYDAALELIHSYRQFLRSDKLMPASRKVFHRNFMKYVSRLVAIAEGSKKFEAGLEIQKLEKEDCAYKEWLTEKFGSFTRIRRKYSIAG